MSTSRHPQTDGQTERANRILEEMLRAYVSHTLDYWDTWPAALEFAYNDSVQASTKATPFYLEYGQHPLCPLDFLNPAAITSNPATDAMVAEIRSSVETAKLCLASAQDRQKYNADKKRRHEQFAVGGKVLLSVDALRFPTVALTTAMKLQAKWLGPFTVTAVVPPSAYALDLPPTIKAHRMFNVSFLKRYVAGDRHQPLAPPVAVIDGEEWWEVEAVVGHRAAGRAPNQCWEFLIHLTGRPAHERSFEPIKEVGSVAVVQDYMRKHKLTPKPALPTSKLVRAPALSPALPARVAIVAPAVIAPPAPPPVRSSKRIAERAARTQRFLEGEGV